MRVHGFDIKKGFFSRAQRILGERKAGGGRRKGPVAIGQFFCVAASKTHEKWAFSPCELGVFMRFCLATPSQFTRFLPTLKHGFVCLLLGCLYLPAQSASLQISGLVDFNFGAVPPSSAQYTSDIPVCVGGESLQGANAYTVILEGDGVAKAFTLSDSVHTVPYRVFWNNQNNTANNQEVVAGVPYSTTGIAQEDLACSTASLNANLQVEIDTQDAVKGTYTGTLAVIVSLD